MSKTTFAIVGSFIYLYLIWGMTFLAIKQAVHEIPPFAVGALRFLSAGVILLLVARRCSPRRLSAAGIRAAAFVGVLLAGIGNGSVIMAERTVPSGIASLWVATVPVWILLMNALFFTRKMPAISSLLGAALGILGIALLPGATVSSETVSSASGVDWIPMAILLVGTWGWSFGTLWQRYHAESGTALHAAAVQATAGGIFLAFLALVTGQWGTFFQAPPSALGWGSLAFLSIFGTVIAYTAFSWLLSVVEPQRVATYALVNPIVALILGAWLGGEALTPETLRAGVLVLGAITLILWKRKAVPQKNQGTEIPQELSVRARAASGSP